MNLQLNDRSITIAIVGCGGFIGSHLLNAILCRTKWRVFGVDVDFYRIQHLLKNERCEFLCADLADKMVVERIAKYPIVVNLAAICIPSRYMDEASIVIRSNFDYPSFLADACERFNSWLIHFSTSEVYGRTNNDSIELVEDESPLTFGPVSASRWSYATAKLLTERYISGLKSLKWTIIRPFNFVGPYMDFMPGVDGEGIPRVLANFSSALLRNTPMKLVNGGLSRRSFTSVYDAIDFMFALFCADDTKQFNMSFATNKSEINDSKVFSQIFNVGNKDNEVTIKELAYKMRFVYAKIKNIDISTIKEPEEISGISYYGKGYEDSLRRIPSTKKAEKILHFKAKTTLDVCLQDSLTWFINHYEVNS